MAEDRKITIDLQLTKNDFRGRTQRAELHLETKKQNFGGGIVSTAYVFWVQPGSQEHAYGFGVCGDFSSRLFHDKTARATQSKIDAQHARIFTPETVENFTHSARQHYAHRREVNREELATA